MDNTRRRASLKGCILRVEMISILIVFSPDPPHHAPLENWREKKGHGAEGLGTRVTHSYTPLVRLHPRKSLDSFVHQTTRTNQDCNEYFTQSVNTKISSGDIVASFLGWVRGYSFVGMRL